jgi:dihydrodipicolinate synthase/N-acetylneuraminate lyase
MQFEWRGIFPALTTKFTSDFELDLPLFSRNLDAQLDAGVHGVILGGTLGEASVLTLEEKETLVRFVMQRVGGKIPVVLNIAEGSTKEAVRQARMAEEWKVDGLMLLPPMRYKPDHRETVVYFQTIAASTALPVMIYNNPVDYKVEVTLDMFDELQSSKNITAVKESTRDTTNVTRMRARFGNRYRILCGVDTLALEELCLGADGWVAGLVCAYPRETVTLFNLVQKGELEKARRLYQWFLPLLELDIHPKLVQYIKMCEAAEGIGSEYVRPPRLIPAGEERERILKIIAQAKSTRQTTAGI